MDLVDAEKCLARPLYSSVMNRIIVIQSKIGSRCGNPALAHDPATHRLPSRASDVTLALWKSYLLFFHASSFFSPIHILQIDDRLYRAEQHLPVFSLQI